MIDVICIGRSSVDLYGQQVGGKLEDMSNFSKYVGGSPTNISIGCSRLGLKSALITKVGNEHMGRFIKERLEKELEKIFKFYDSKIIFKKLINDGTYVDQNSTPFLVEGNARSILATERLVLNTMQRMSGIATMTNSLKNKIKSFKSVILDTRKTTPNFRYPEKWAVKIGGGKNHRMGLFDAIMIKDNHIDYSENIENVLKKTEVYLQNNSNKKIFVVVEVRDIVEINKILKFSWVDRVLLDNMNLRELKKAVRLINGEIKTEASGDINEDNIIDVAKTGVDYISIGALTHSAPNIDLSLKAQ